MHTKVKNLKPDYLNWDCPYFLVKMTFEKVRLYLNLKTTESAQHIRNIRYSFKRQETWCNISSYREWYLYDNRQVSYSTLFIGSLLCSQPKTCGTPVWLNSWEFLVAWMYNLFLRHDMAVKSIFDSRPNYLSGSSFTESYLEFEPMEYLYFCH